MLHLASQTGQLLHDDHMATIEMLRRLDTLLSQHSIKKVPDLASPNIRAIFSDTRSILEREMGRHFGFEEEHLFPRLVDLGQSCMTNLLKAEHRAILPVAEDVARLMGEALAASTMSDCGWRQLRERAEELIEREANHIQKEEMGLLTAIASLVDADEDARLAAAFRALEDTPS